MNSRDRVHAALQRQPTDRVPIFMWFHPETQQCLAELLEISWSDVPRALGHDIRQTWVGNNFSMEGEALTNDGDSFIDPWNIEWTKQGPFNQIRNSPLQNAAEEKVRNYYYPYSHTEELLLQMDRMAKHSSEFFIGMDISPCAFEMVNRLRGMEQSMLDLVENSELAEMMYSQAADFATHLAREGLARYEIDWLWTGDDVGGQQGMMMSPSMWRDFIKPHLQRIFTAAREHHVWLAFHSCGAIRPIIPDLIEMGVDVLNPLQGNCPGMEPLELKREFGRDLAFMGGVDTQYRLPRGSANEVYAYTKNLIEAMTEDGGGYILAASHTVPPETPIANIFALYQAAGLEREAVFDNAAAIRAEKK